MDNSVTEMIETGDRPKWTSHSNHNIKCFTESELERITSNYGAMLGKGGFGEVYKGVLEDGSTVAVKRFVHNIEEDFAKELKVHSEINHKNVVRLIGYCAQKNSLTIVTEYICKGNLSHLLHHECIPIPLDTRLRIAMECSEALCYLHSQMYTRVIHGDIKPANILLDDKFNAKLSDFGISRLINTDVTVFTQHVIGSIGYMDPLFAQNGRLTSKSDVYSFGIVLLELITRKTASVTKGEAGIVECFIQAHATGTRRVRELFDAEISSQENMKALEGVAKLARQCLKLEMDRRPEMIDVALRLRSLWKTQVRGKQTRTIFSWGWRNKPSAQDNDQSSGGSEAHVLQSCRQFSFEELKTATRNFAESHLLGVGRSGNVYYGVIDGGATKVVIKRPGRVKEEDIATMEKLSHPHLISLLGYCRENKQLALIYDFMPCGTLHEKLYGHNTEEPQLTWTQRLEVCIAAARALQYLHECSIVHCDLTSTKKILLDKRWVVKVSPAISPKQHYSPNEATNIGSVGSVDPEISFKRQLTEKSDVYSFGVVLFEVLCARAATVFDPPSMIDLVTWVLNCEKGIMRIIAQIVDPYLKERIAPQLFIKFVETAKKCVAKQDVDRPSMTEVLWDLELCVAEESEYYGKMRRGWRRDLEEEEDQGVHYLDGR